MDRCSVGPSGVHQGQSRRPYRHWRASKFDDAISARQSLGQGRGRSRLHGYRRETAPGCRGVSAECANRIRSRLIGEIDSDFELAYLSVWAGGAVLAAGAGGGAAGGGLLAALPEVATRALVVA